MADISKITLPDNVTYNIKDTTARNLAGGKSSVSVYQTLTSGTKIGGVVIDGTDTSLYTPAAPTVKVKDVYINGTSCVDANGIAKVTSDAGDFTINGNVRLLKGQGISSAQDDGTYGFLIHQSSANNVIVGYGNYARGTGGTFVYGSNKVGFISDSDVEVTANGSKTVFSYTGEVFFPSDVYVNGHEEAIGFSGYSETAVSHSWNSSTNWVALDTINLTAGSYILVGEIKYPSNSSGRRGVQWYNETDGTELSHSSVVVSATNGVCYVQSVAITEITGNNKYRLRGLQNSGSNLAVTSSFRCIRIA